MIRIKASQRKNQREFFTAEAQRREENTSNSHSLRLGVSAFFSCPNLVSFYAFHCFFYDRDTKANHYELHELSLHLSSYVLNFSVNLGRTQSHFF